MDELLAKTKDYFRQKFDGVIRIEIDNAPSAIWVDGRGQPPVVSSAAPENVSGDFCLWRSSPETLTRVLSPETRRLEGAYIAGRLAISGDMAVMGRLEIGHVQEGP